MARAGAHAQAGRGRATRGSVSCVICIVGGGYLGLWPALRIKDLDPTVSAVVVEADLVGAGPPGRNGAWRSRGDRRLTRSSPAWGATRASAVRLHSRESPQRLLDRRSHRGALPDHHLLPPSGHRLRRLDGEEILRLPQSSRLIAGAMTHWARSLLLVHAHGWAGDTFRRGQPVRLFVWAARFALKIEVQRAVIGRPWREYRHRRREA